MKTPNPELERLDDLPSREEANPDEQPLELFDMHYRSEPVEYRGQVAPYMTEFDDEGIQRIRSREAFSVMAKIGVQGAVSKYKREVEQVASPEWITKFEERTRRFVGELTGFEPVQTAGGKPGLPKLKVVSAIPDGRTETTSGAYYTDHTVLLAHDAARFTDMEPERIEVERVAEVLNMAHELAHGAVEADENVAITVDDGLSRALQGQTIGMTRLELSARVGSPNMYQGNFYEEAWAEQVVGRYNVHLRLVKPGRPIHNMEHFFEGAEGLNLDSRYVRYAEGHGTMCASSIAAFSIDMLEDCRREMGLGDRTLFEMMRDSRHKETRTEATREFIKTLNAIQPGLYRELRVLKYKTDDFLKGSRIVQAVHKEKAPVSYGRWQEKVADAQRRAVEAA